MRMKSPRRARRTTSSSSTLQLAFLVASACLVCCCSSASSSAHDPTPVSFLTPPIPPLLENRSSSDRDALLAFRSSVAGGDPTGALLSWNDIDDSSDFCRWRGVTCSSGRRRRRRPDRVVGLDLHSLGLSGPIPTSVTNLTSLRSLDLSNNSFHGRIPEELGRLPRLRVLNLNSNSLDGDLPAGLGRCTELRHMNLRRNSLSGELPPSLVNLSSLRSLDLSRNRLRGSIPPQLGGIATLVLLNLVENNLTGGIPASLGNLTQLGRLSLTRNSLTGTIPPAMGKLRGSLTWLTAETNRLSGPFPSSLCNLSSLALLALGGNQFSGTLPPDFGLFFPNLRNLSLSSNKFHGPIPSSIANASSLQVVQMDANAFTGAVPSTLGTLKNLNCLALWDNQLGAGGHGDWSFVTALANCTRLEVLDLQANRLGGALPESVSNLSKGLTWLTLQGNLISGTVPTGIGDLVGLTILTLGNNLIGGTIPGTVGKLQNLGVLHLRNNRLSGQIPPSVFNLTRMHHFSIEMNQLKGSLSPSFGKLHNLQKVYLSANHFGGTIPKELFTNPALSLLAMAGNSLTGTLPSEIRQLRSINMMDISENELQGEIPSAMGECELLVYVDLHGNKLRGKIPRSFERLRGLEVFDVSMNNLSGSIPGFLPEFRYLSYLNLSFNDFGGEAPKGGIFRNASAVSVVENPRLCGGVPQLRLRPCSIGSEPKRRRPHRHALLMAAVTIPSVSLCVIVAILCVFFVLRRKRRSSSPAMATSREMLPRVTYYELFKATEGFSPHKLIGAGSFGSVYEGKMDVVPATADHAAINGRSVAVKVINLLQHGASKSFMRECEALKSIRHRNLVKILTSCSSADFQGNDFKALVFEFMPNGSLEQWLHPRLDQIKGDVHCDDQKAQQLGLAQRLNIAVDVAMAISYLHSHNPSPIVHRDLKPSNVLLDTEMVAHVSDFGLARFLCSENNLSTSSLAFEGSIGYVAPEYGMGCSASTEGDVYGYGILLLEMATGRRPTDAMFAAGDSTLHEYVRTAFPDRVLDVVDPSLLRELGTDRNNIAVVLHGGRPSPEGMNEYYLRREEARLACLASMLRLGLTCSKDSPKERVEMEAVVKEMTAIRERFLIS